VRSIAEHNDHRVGGALRWGVESICRVLTEHGCPIAASTYYDAASRAPSRRERRDADLAVHVARVHAEHYGVYGPRKVWLQLNREGVPVARCTVERLMRTLGLEGARRGRRWRTTIADPAATRPVDLVQRRFDPPAPNLLWVADFPYCPTWSGMVYVAFVIDAYSRRVLGWLDRVDDHRAGPRRGRAGHLVRARDGIADLTGPVHSNEPVLRRPVESGQYTSIAFTDRFNHRRLYQVCGDIPPAELERAYYRHHAALAEVGQSTI
jgi:putative transposase